MKKPWKIRKSESSLYNKNVGYFNQAFLSHRQIIEVKNADGKKHRRTKRRMGQKIDEKTWNSKKRRKDKTSNGK